MNQEIVPINQETSSIIEEYERRVWDIPLNNSDFENRYLNSASKITPHRQYQDALKGARKQINQLRHTHFAIQKENLELESLSVDIDEIESRLSSSDLSDYERKKLVIEKRRKEVEIQEIKSRHSDRNKLINDVLHELSTNYEVLSSFPQYTREQFEAGERLYFEKHFERQIKGLVGAKQGILNITEDKKSIDYVIENNCKILGMIGEYAHGNGGK